MIRSNVKKQAERFIRDFKYFTPSYSALREIIQKQGYTIVEFNNIYNDENVTLLLESLHLDEYAERSKGFTYADSRRRLLFLNEDLSEDEKLMVLAHEEGHIYCNHFSSVPIIGKDVVEEHEANEFAHHILNQGLACKIKRFPNEHRKATWVCISLAVVLVVGLVLTGIVKKERQYYGEYYLTDSGNKYHEKDCIFVKNKNNTRRMTIEEFESGDYEPCGICLPHGSDSPD